MNLQDFFFAKLPVEQHVCLGNAVCLGVANSVAVDASLSADVISFSLAFQRALKFVLCAPGRMAFIFCHPDQVAANPPCAEIPLGNAVFEDALTRVIFTYVRTLGELCEQLAILRPSSSSSLVVVHDGKLEEADTNHFNGTASTVQRFKMFALCGVLMHSFSSQLVFVSTKRYADSPTEPNCKNLTDAAIVIGRPTEFGFSTKCHAICPSSFSIWQIADEFNPLISLAIRDNLLIVSLG